MKFHTGMERELKRAKNGRLFLIPASEETRGRGTTGMAPKPAMSHPKRKGRLDGGRGVLG